MIVAVQEQPRARNRSVGKRGPHLKEKALRRVPIGEGYARLAESIGDRIYNVRRELGVSAAELAAACGVTESQVHRWESNTGGRGITLRRLVQVARALGVLPLDLLPSEET